MKTLVYTILTSCLVILGGCQVETCYPIGDNWPYKHFDVSKQLTTSSLGYKVDDPKSELNVKALDETLANVVQCMNQQAPLTKAELIEADCNEKPEVSVKACLTVKAAPNWIVSTCSGSQVFDCDAPQSGCLAKGITPTDSCPCRCRALNQDFEVLVTTPNLELVPWRFVEMTTGCYQIQYIARYQECASPERRPKWFTDSLTAVPK